MEPRKHQHTRHPLTLTCVSSAANQARSKPFFYSFLSSFSVSPPPLPELKWQGLREADYHNEIILIFCSTWSRGAGSCGLRDRPVCLASNHLQTQFFPGLETCRWLPRCLWADASLCMSVCERETKMESKDRIHFLHLCVSVFCFSAVVEHIIRLCIILLGAEIFN